MIQTRNLRSSYKDYKQGVSNPVDINTYLKIAQGFILYIMRKLFEGHDIQLGPGDSLGTLGVRGRKIATFTDKNGEIKGAAPSWSKTKKLWDENPEAKANRQLVYCTNEHTNGLTFKIVWFKKDMRLHNKSYYTIIFSRKNKRTLSKLIKEGKEYYSSNPYKRWQRQPQ